MSNWITLNQIEMQKWWDRINRKVLRMIARFDAWGWPTRDAAAPEEEC